jgi:hypothetical protein
MNQLICAAAKGTFDLKSLFLTCRTPAKGRKSFFDNSIPAACVVNIQCATASTTVKRRVILSPTGKEVVGTCGDDVRTTKRKQIELSASKFIGLKSCLLKFVTVGPGALLVDNVVISKVTLCDG